jgi:regulator of cell morphogenesis and NO signaling
MKIERSSSIAKVAADVPGAMDVFEALGLDYACAGDLSVADAAHIAAIDPDAVVGRLRRLKSVRNAISWNDRRLTDVMQHLTVEHHRLVSTEMRATAVCLADVCTAPAGAPLEVHSLRATFARLSDILLPHIREEEENIFPLIERLERAWESGESQEDAEELRDRISRIVADHGQIAMLLRTMRNKRERLMMSDETPPSCQPILEGIGFLEAHLHQSMFLENAVLFPRAVALASQLGTLALQR